MMRWWTGLVQRYGETNMVKFVYMMKWWDGKIYWNRNTVKLIWWDGWQSTHPCSHGEMEIWWNRLVKILAFGRCRFLGTLQRWVPILLLHFIRWCITCWGKSCLEMMPTWFSKRPMIHFNTLWCCIPLVLSNKFLLFVLLFIPPATANTGRVGSILHLSYSWHCPMHLHWRYN